MDNLWLVTLFNLQISSSFPPNLILAYRLKPFWAAAPKGQCPVGHRGEFPDVHPSVHPSVDGSPFWTAAPKGQCPVGDRSEFPYVRPSVRPYPPPPLRPNSGSFRHAVRPKRPKSTLSDLKSPLSGSRFALSGSKFSLSDPK